MWGYCCQQRGYNHKYGQDSGKLPPGFPSCSSPDTYKVEVFRFPVIPWKPTGYSSNSDVIIVPRNITMRDLMQQELHLNNHNASQNVVIQLVQRSYGQFSKKMEFRGDNSERMSMSLSDLEQNRDQSSSQADIRLWVSDLGMH